VTTKVTADVLNDTLDLSSKTITMPTANTPALTKSYTSANQTITAAGALTLAHGLGTMPLLIQARMKCLSSEVGYTTGDEVIINPCVNGSGTGQALTIVPDATNLNIRIPQAANSIVIANKGTGVTATITDANWALIFRAWA